MSRNSSINGNRHPYLRLEAWDKGIKGQAPLAEPWLKRTRPALGKKLSPAEWITEWIQKERKADRHPEQEIINRNNP